MEETPRTLPIDIFVDRLSSAANDQPNNYVETYSLHFRFQEDDSGADDDAGQFQLMLCELGLPPAEEFIVKPSASPLDFSVRAKLLAMRMNIQFGEGRKLCIVHYAGYSGFDQYNKLFLRPTIGGPLPTVTTGIELERILSDINESGEYMHPPESESVDFIFIIDACISSSVVRRNPHSAGRVVEIVAAGESVYEEDALNIRTQNKSLTAKMYDYLMSVKEVSQSFQLSEMVSALRAEWPAYKPIHRIVVGPKSICLPFRRVEGSTFTRPASPARSTASSTHSAIFSVHITETLDEEQVEEVTMYVSTLGGDRKYRLTGAYRVESTALFLKTPYSIYTQLRNLPGVELMFENRTSKVGKPNEIGPDLGNEPTIFLLQAPQDIYQKLKHLPGVNLVVDNVTGGNMVPPESITGPQPAPLEEPFMRKMLDNYADVVGVEEEVSDPLEEAEKPYDTVSEGALYIPPFIPRRFRWRGRRLN
ncbi:hypothetical protein AJ79_07825 [Helicocarpus griseus UAMH5409]|uniref:Uncharacterized protein n=1 Tax=Helicocarpus griseus UAMH5409 TaxID=1447875 RepID=A0A2B7WYX9_9EURO|nr:hypothetical protein AJ79_07825 [Helicocarpus griseus UAMH5409]